MKLSLRIPLIVVASVILAAGTIAGISTWRIGAALEAQARERLVGQREARRGAIENYVRVLDELVTSITSSPSTHDALQEFSFAVPLVAFDPKTIEEILKKLYPDNDSDGIVDNLDEAAVEKTSHYRDVHIGYHRYFKAFLRLNGVDDITLVSRTGTVFYSVAKSPLFATDLVRGKWRDGSAGNLFRALKSSPTHPKAVYSDFGADRQGLERHGGGHLGA